MTERASQERRLAITLIALTTFALAALGLRWSASGHLRATEIDVHRLNLREESGALRLVIANGTHLPGIILRGEEHPHPNRKGAAILFFNEEGTENGGIQFGGRRGPDGAVEAEGAFTIDQYEQDQVAVLFTDQRGPRRTAGLSIADRHDHFIGDDIRAVENLPRMTAAERETWRRERLEAGTFGATRAVVARSDDGAAAVRLKDGKGRDRLVLRVEPGGAASLEFRDETGAVLRRLPEQGDPAEPVVRSRTP